MRGHGFDTQIADEIFFTMVRVSDGNWPSITKIVCLKRTIHWIPQYVKEIVLIVVTQLEYFKFFNCNSMITAVETCINV